SALARQSRHRGADTAHEAGADAAPRPGPPARRLRTHWILATDGYTSRVQRAQRSVVVRRRALEGLEVTAPSFWLDRPTLVTGATGLVGTWLVSRLLASGADVV